MKIAILDNYDSFTYNLFQYFGELGERPIVVRNNELTFEQFCALDVDRIVISPGPGRPDVAKYFGICTRVIRELGQTTPILGVCLGHQGIIHAFGGRVIRASQVMHGKTSTVFHNDIGIFAGLKNAFEAMRYQSLIGDKESLPGCLKITAKTWDEVIMGVQHETLPIHGIQFHPESIGTPLGKQLLRRFMDL